MEENGVPGGRHRPVASHWQTLLHNVVSSTPWLSMIQTHNVSGGRHWLHSYTPNYLNQYENQLLTNSCQYN